MLQSQLREDGFCPDEWMNAISLHLYDEDVVFLSNSKAVCADSPFAR